MGHAEDMREMYAELRTNPRPPVVTTSEHEIIGWEPMVKVPYRQFSLPGLEQYESPKQVGGDHYSKLKIQPVDYILQNNLGYLEGNVVKYVTRHLDKNGVQDIDKAIHYLEMIKEKHYAS